MQMEMTTETLADVEFSVSFAQHDEFKDSYFRNNRACGQKNIRCFPTCADEHVEKHFCGKPLRINLSMLIRRPNKEFMGFEDIRLIAEFKLLDSVNGIHSSVRLDDLKSKIKSKLSPTNPYFLGRIVNSETPVLAPCGGTLHRCTVDFNAECKGWHYSWVGSRFKTCVSHVISVTVLSIDHKASSPIFEAPVLDDDEDIEEAPSPPPDTATAVVYFKPVAHFDSPSFQVASLRRKSDRAGYLLGLSATCEHQSQYDDDCDEQLPQQSETPFRRAQQDSSFSFHPPQFDSAVCTYSSVEANAQAGFGYQWECEKQRCTPPSSSSSSCCAGMPHNYSDASCQGNDTAYLALAMKSPAETIFDQSPQPPSLLCPAAFTELPLTRPDYTSIKAPNGGVEQPVEAVFSGAAPLEELYSSSAVCGGFSNNYESTLASSRSNAWSGAPLLSLPQHMEYTQYQPHLQCPPMAAPWRLQQQQQSPYYYQPQQQFTSWTPTYIGQAPSGPPPHSVPWPCAPPGTTWPTSLSPHQASSLGKTVLGLDAEVFVDIASTYSESIMRDDGAIAAAVSAVLEAGCRVPLSLADFPSFSVVERALNIIDTAETAQVGESYRLVDAKSSLQLSSMVSQFAAFLEEPAPLAGDGDVTNAKLDASAASPASRAAGAKRKWQCRDGSEDTSLDSLLDGDDNRGSDQQVRVNEILRDNSGSIALLARVVDYMCSEAHAREQRLESHTSTVSGPLSSSDLLTAVRPLCSAAGETGWLAAEAVHAQCFPAAVGPFSPKTTPAPPRIIYLDMPHPFRALVAANSQIPAVTPRSRLR